LQIFAKSDWSHGVQLKIDRELLTTTILAHHSLYDVLAVSPAASLKEIKEAYHRALLKYHPDKNGTGPLDISAVKAAYSVLSSTELRTKYDEALREEDASLNSRPAQLISLDDFTECCSAADHSDEVSFSHGCRCGGTFTVSEHDLEIGRHLISCDSCSEVVWVGYELAE
jgi:diphthamide biosynthesis protein 4